ncbi:MAG: hypothetical protein COB15_00995 [Flavobacteriales bacterium]|nr:MAG: hypothetical protein COB15_00995 [Flavobacteriales bacterium]
MGLIVLFINRFVAKMKKVLIILAVLLTHISNAQLTVSSGVMTPTQYVQNVLVGGGVTVSNVTFTGDPSQIGSFDGTATTIGIGPGLMLGSGDVNGAIGPNNDGSMALPVGGFMGPGDPDLYDIINPTTGTTVSVDAAVLEFDFIPTGDTIKFNYVFGSEEYLEFAPPTNPMGVNDAFGFFLSGPGIAGPFSSPLAFPNGSINIALIPGTTTPVTINNVNPVTNPAYYIDNGDGLTAPFSTGVQYVQYDGLTTVLTAVSEVQCGLTYHIKIAISDAMDGSWDSGVFLQAGSFSSNMVLLSSNVDVGANDSILYEGCGSALLDFVRTNTTDTATYNYIVTGTSDTTDYTISASSVVFLPGQDTVTLSFNAIQDGLVEPLETVVIELVQTICSVIDTQSITFYISDYPQPVLTMHDTLKACGSTDSVPVWVNVLGPPHNTSWNTTPVQTTDTIWVNPNATTTYTVTVTDTCGVNTVIDSAIVTVIVPAPVILTTLNDTSKYCPQDSILVYVTPSGGGGSYTYSWNPGGATDSSIYVSPGTTTTYVVDVTDLCGTITKDSLTITVPNFVPLTNIITTNDVTICPGDPVVLNANVSGGVGTYLSWNNGVGTAVPANVNPTVTTSYILTAQDSCGAIALDTVLISITPSNFQINLPDSINMDCLNETILLDPAITGGAGTETYLWSTTDTTTTIQVAPLATTTYFLAISDACTITSDTVKVVVPVFNLLGFGVNNNILVNCPGDPVVLIANVTPNTGSGETLVVNWTDGTTNFTGNNLTVNPTTNTTYTAFVKDTCANDSSTASFTVAVPNYAPLQMTLSDDMLICLGDHISLGVGVLGGNTPYSYSWTGGASSDSIQVAPTFDMSYNIVVTDACGSQIDSSVSVSVASPTADFSYEYISQFDVEFIDSSYYNISAHWWTFENIISTEVNPIHTFSGDGQFDVWLKVEDDNGCFDSIMKTIIPPQFVYAPNSFTPDGDDLNEDFRFSGMGIKSFKLLIYDKWGELMFQTENISNGWDGNYKGKPVPAGSYVYKVYAESYENIIFESAGNITLIR